MKANLYILVLEVTLMLFVTIATNSVCDKYKVKLGSIQMSKSISIKIVLGRLKPTAFSFLLLSIKLL